MVVVVMAVKKVLVILLVVHYGLMWVNLVDNYPRIEMKGCWIGHYGDYPVVVHLHEVEMSPTAGANANANVGSPLITFLLS